MPSRNFRRKTIPGKINATRSSAGTAMFTNHPFHSNQTVRIRRYAPPNTTARRWSPAVYSPCQLVAKPFEPSDSEGASVSIVMSCRLPCSSPPRVAVTSGHERSHKNYYTSDLSVKEQVLPSGYSSCANHNPWAPTPEQPALVHRTGRRAARRATAPAPASSHRPEVP